MSLDVRSRSARVTYTNEQASLLLERLQLGPQAQILKRQLLVETLQPARADAACAGATSWATFSTASPSTTSATSTADV